MAWVKINENPYNIPLFFSSSANLISLNVGFEELRQKVTLGSRFTWPKSNSECGQELTLDEPLIIG